MGKQGRFNHVEILIVEDSPTQLEQLRHLLEGNGYSVRPATNGKKALEEARRQPPTVIVSDIVMPEMDGYALCQAVRKDELLKDTPVVLLTSLSGPQDVIEALKCGADNFIRKPYDERHLLLRIENILTNRKLRATDTVKVGVELQLAGEKHFITAERQQILDLLISTYEQAVQMCGELKLREDQLDRANRVLSGIYAITKGLNQAQTEREVLDVAVELALQLPDVRAGWIFLRDDESHFRLATSRNLPSELATPEIMDGDCLCRRKVLSGEIERAANIEECERLKKAKINTLGLRSHVTLPFRFGDKVLGIMNLVGTQDVLFTEDDLRVLNGIGNQIGVALQRCRLHENLEELVRERTSALSESEERYRRLVNEITDGMFITDNEGTIQFANDALVRIHGFTSAEQLVGRRFVEFLDPSIPQEVARRFARVVDGKEEAGLVEVEIIREGGGSAFLEVRPAPIREGGRIVGARGTVQDITERRRAEEHSRVLQAQLLQAQKMESIGALAGGIAHDFNNILGIILGHASILERMAGKPDVLPASVEAITKAVTRGASLVRQLLTFSRKAETAIETVHINDLVEELVKMMRETFPKIITLRTDLADHLPAMSADVTQLHQALLNLAINGRDAMPEGGTLTFRTVTAKGEQLRHRFPDAHYDDYLSVTVVDTGTGMEEETQRRIFEPFFTTKGPGKGTGLGMSVVYGVVKSHEGILDFQSTPGKGSTFTLYFPVKAKEVVQEQEKGKAWSGDVPGGTETILVVEDEEMLRELVGAVLSSKGYKVIVAEDGVEAIAQYDAHASDIALVLCDNGLPRLDGVGLVKALKQKQRDLKFIMASGYIDARKRGEIIRAGVTEFTSKPYAANELLWRIRQVLDRR
ncbi:MAG: response regulator [Ignavibacteriales bacterium]|nr:response regulator [Ignavibacteriales bacterium]